MLVRDPILVLVVITFTNKTKRASLSRSLHGDIWRLKHKIRPTLPLLPEVARDVPVVKSSAVRPHALPAPDRDTVSGGMATRR